MEAKYKCIRRCYFGKGETVAGKAPSRRVYEVGDTETFDPEKERVPRHFVPIEQFTAAVPEEPYKAILQGVRAPVDRDKLAEIESKKRPAFNPVDAMKQELINREEAVPKKK